MKITLIALLAMMASSYSYSLGRVVSYEEIKGDLFGTIRKVTICGTYSHKDVVGEVRLIETYTYGGSMIFIDTIKIGGSGLALLHGVSIQEINNDHLELSIENLSCVDLSNNKIQVNGRVNGTGHEENVKYEFTVKYEAHEGAYKFTENVNK